MTDDHWTLPHHNTISIRYNDRDPSTLSANQNTLIFNLRAKWIKMPSPPQMSPLLWSHWCCTLRLMFSMPPLLDIALSAKPTVEPALSVMNHRVPFPISFRHKRLQTNLTPKWPLSVHCHRPLSFWTFTFMIAQLSPRCVHRLAFHAKIQIVRTLQVLR